MWLWFLGVLKEHETWWNGFQIPFHIFLKRNSYSVSQILKFVSWNGIPDPFQKNVKRNLKSVSKKKLETFWNGFCNPFHIFLKRNTYSVSQIFQFFHKMDYVIRFKMVWNGFQNAFHKDSVFFWMWNQFHTFWNLRMKSREN